MSHTVNIATGLAIEVARSLTRANVPFTMIYRGVFEQTSITCDHQLTLDSTVELVSSRLGLDPKSRLRVALDPETPRIDSGMADAFATVRNLDPDDQ